MNKVERKLLLNGDRFAILAVYLRSDGASGELANETLIDPVADLGMKAGERLRLNRVTHSFAGFDAVLSFGSGGVDPNWQWVLTSATNQPFDFGEYGNLIDDSSMDGNGKLTISTTGFTAAGDQGSLLIRVRKP